MSHDPAAHGGLVQPKYRPDIDGLRAVAVLPVVAFHAFPHLLTGGFIGVDIFFVISGFLISTIIFENLERGSFSFADFYARRVRRIFPALSMVLATTLVLGWLLLFTEEFRNVARHVAAGSAFIANFALWQESGYFDAATTAKPLIHLWSLGVEEQFYIVWPFLVWLAWKWRANIMLLLVAVALASFAVTMIMLRTDTVGMFFSPLSRFWELLAGAGLAWLLRSRPTLANPTGTWRHAASIVGLALIGGGVLFMSEELVFPGAWAFIPVVGAVLLILSGPTAVVNRWVLANPVMVWFGLISYPLYLWHWPFLSYEWIVYGAPEATVKIVAVAVSILLAWVTYRFIERPVRRAKGMGHVAPLGGVMASLLAVALVLHYGPWTTTRIGESAQSADLPYEVRKAFDTGLEQGTTCTAILGLPHLSQQNCHVTGPAPRIMVIGDSHSSAVFQPFVHDKLSVPALLMGSNGCDLYPNLDIRRLNNSPYGLNCRAVANEVLRVAAALPSLETIVVAQAWPEIRRRNEPNDYLDGTRTLEYYGALEVGGSALLAGLEATGRKVVWLVDVPTFGQLPETCERAAGLGAGIECDIPRAAYDRQREDYREALARLAAGHPSVSFIDPTSSFCDASLCSMVQDGRYLYRDTEHLNLAGARRVLESHLAQPLGLAGSQAAAP
ncbi:MAG: hypothetical protein RL026_1558 [Pseudomonadota bacterium]